MSNSLACVEGLVFKADFELDLHLTLKDQPVEIQTAYLTNDQTTLRNLFGANKPLPHKKTIFTLL